jgi:hypothetical protein
MMQREDQVLPGEHSLSGDQRKEEIGARIDSRPFLLIVRMWKNSFVVYVVDRSVSVMSR